MASSTCGFGERSGMPTTRNSPVSSRSMNAAVCSRSSTRSMTRARRSPGVAIRHLAPPCTSPTTSPRTSTSGAPESPGVPSMLVCRAREVRQRRTRRDPIEPCRLPPWALRVAVKVEHRADARDAPHDPERRHRHRGRERQHDLVRRRVLVHKLRVAFDARHPDAEPHAVVDAVFSRRHEPRRLDDGTVSPSMIGRWLQTAQLLHGRDHVVVA